MSSYHEDLAPRTRMDNIDSPFRHYSSPLYGIVSMYPLPPRNWCRSVGAEQNRWLGLGYHQLRLVGRYRSRRNT